MANLSAAWTARFRVPFIRIPQVAGDAPERGLVISNVSETFQLHAWDVPSGRLRRLTSRPTGTAAGVLAPDGRFVYYHDDADGNELGHFVRVPFDGGTPETITPGLAPYPTFGLSVSGSGNRLGFVTADADGYHLHVVDVRADGALGPPRRIHSRSRLLDGPVFSYDGTIAVLAAAPEGGCLRYELVALQTADGRILSELADVDGRLGPAAFAPVAGDARLLGQSNRSGANRPLIWDVARDTRIDIALDELDGDVLPADWSPDGRRLLLVQLDRAVHRLYVYDVQSAALTPLRHPAGTYGQVYFAPEPARTARSTSRPTARSTPSGRIRPNRRR